MRARTLVLTAAVLLGLAACGGAAGSDPLTPRVCKALTEAAARTPQPDADTMQMWVVLGIANEAGEDINKLGAYVSKADAETEAACPDARKAVLDVTGKASLAAVIR
jgi:hypothetical protein